VICFRIQELDGSFFEKFGTLLKEQHAQEENGDGLASVNEEQQLDDAAETGGGPAMALQDSDSEPDDSDKHEFITDAMGWNVSSRVGRAHKNLPFEFIPHPHNLRIYGRV
jgi:hypothetical protein